MRAGAIEARGLCFLSGAVRVKESGDDDGFVNRFFLSRVLRNVNSSKETTRLFRTVLYSYQQNLTDQQSDDATRLTIKL